MPRKNKPEVPPPKKTAFVPHFPVTPNTPPEPPKEFDPNGEMDFTPAASKDD